jgi:hypothetical protein
MGVMVAVGIIVPATVGSVVEEPVKVRPGVIVGPRLGEGVTGSVAVGIPGVAVFIGVAVEDKLGDGTMVGVCEVVVVGVIVEDRDGEVAGEGVICIVWVRDIQGDAVIDGATVGVPETVTLGVNVEEGEGLVPGVLVKRGTLGLPGEGSSATSQSAAEFVSTQ